MLGEPVCVSKDAIASSKRPLSLGCYCTSSFAHTLASADALGVE